MLKSIFARAVLAKSKIIYKFRHQLKYYSLKGIRLSIDDKQLSEDILLSVLQGGYEDKEYNVIVRNMSPEDIVLELGAGLGFNSILAAKITGNKILSYEANPFLLPLIKHNQQLNGVSFEVINKILTSNKSSEEKTLFHIAENVCMSSAKDFVAPGYSIVKNEMIETEFLGDVLSSFCPTFFVVDIEGGEENIFGVPETIKNSSIKKILVEVHPEITGENAVAIVIKNITLAGFNLETSQSTESVLFFTRW